MVLTPLDRERLAFLSQTKMSLLTTLSCHNAITSTHINRLW